MFTLNIQPSQSPKMRQVASYGFSRTLMGEPNVQIIKNLNVTDRLELSKVIKKMKSCRKLIDEIIPAALWSTVKKEDPYYSFSGDIEIQKPTERSMKKLNETQNKQVMLNKDHWKLKSEISGNSFLENNYGLQKNQHSSCESRIFFLASNRAINSPQLMFARGFKTLRSDPELRNTNNKNTSEVPFGGTPPELKLGGINDKYAEGYLAGMLAFQQTKTSEGTTKSKTDIWSRLGKFQLLLWSLVGILVLHQFTGFRFGISRGANEIMPEDIEVTFDDVKGCDEAKQELQEIVDFLMNPEKFSVLGGKLPKGCLLEGPPGTGKTLLAKAVAGQAGVPFFQASGSEFDEVLVGQGARRVRDLFKTAKQRAPCVVFIDEIDSVGGKRTSSTLHPYANQTINQLLAEMDGFVSNEGVIVIGATNRKDQLDKALLRPGRFDSEIRVEVPDMKGRKEILELYLSKIKHDQSVNIDKLARMTVGFTPAELENMVNTSAIRAAVEEKEWVTMTEFEYSHDKATIGTDWKSRVRHKDDLLITAYHEAGHTLVNIFTENTDPVHKVTIVSKGQSGGHTAVLPERDASYHTKAKMLAKLDVFMGGRVAEEIMFGKEKVTGGASSDLAQATSIATSYVKKLGMSEKYGLRVTHGEEEQMMSESTKNLMDAEINRLLNESYKNATGILKAHRRELDLLADALLKYETLDSDDIRAIIDGNPKKLAHKNTLTSSSKILYKNSGNISSLPAGNTEDIGPSNTGVLA